MNCLLSQHYQLWESVVISLTRGNKSAKLWFFNVTTIISIIAFFVDWSGIFWAGGLADGPGIHSFHWQGLLTQAIPPNGDPDADWLGSEPNGNNENCLGIKIDGGWIDLDCSISRSFICERVYWSDIPTSTVKIIVYQKLSCLIACKFTIITNNSSLKVKLRKQP